MRSVLDYWIMTLAPSTNAVSQQTRRNPSQALRLLHRLHFFAGIICAPLIFIAALTGLVYAFSPTIENISNQEMLTVTKSADSTALPVREQVSIAQELHPDLDLSGVRLGDDSSTTRVLFADETFAESTVRAVFVDPYTGEITGDTTQYGSSAALPFRHWVSQGHRMLWLGEPGRIYSELAASWLGVLAVGGLALLWSRNKNPGRLKKMVRTGGQGRVKTYRRHAALGTVAGLGFVFLTFTGLTWSTYAGSNITDLRTQLNWTQPSVNASLTAAPKVDMHDEHAGHHMHMESATSSSGSIDLVAATAISELRTPLTITPPAQDGLAWTATENRDAYRFTTDTIAVDGDTGMLTNRLNSTDWPLAAQASAWLIQLHMGTLFGLPNQVVLGLLAASIIVMIGLGYWMLWQRRPREGWPSAPKRAGFEKPSWGTIALGVVVIAYGLLAPLFAVSLLVFIGLSLGVRFISRASRRADTSN